MAEVAAITEDEIEVPNVISAASNRGMVINYNQAYWGIEKYMEKSIQEQRKSFEQIAHYLVKFEELNPDAYTDMKKNDEGEVTHVFVSPGYSNEAF